MARLGHISVDGTVQHTSLKTIRLACFGCYGKGELSTDRANAARRVMQASGVRADQVTQVRGFADQRLRKPENALDPANRRISVIVQYILKNDEDEKSEAASGEKQSGESEKDQTSPERKE